MEGKQLPGSIVQKEIVTVHNLHSNILRDVQKSCFAGFSAFRGASRRRLPFYCNMKKKELQTAN